MTAIGLTLGTLVLLWALLHLKTSRPDGVLIRDLHPVRKLMGFIMPSRNGAVVYFDTEIDAQALLDYLEEVEAAFHADVTHCLVAAGFITLLENPTMNRFSVGRRLYQRNGCSLTFSMKRRRLDRAAKLATVKLTFRPGENFRDLCERIEGRIGVERSSERTYADKEMGLLERIPRPVLRGAVQLLKTLDYFNLLPASFIENDSLYTSMFCANLGSLNMGAGFHHLYEWGNCPAFMMAGRIEDRPAVVDGEIVVRKTLPIRWTYDERIDDGLNARFGLESVKHALEHPYEYLGCLKADGSDARPLDKGAPSV